MWEYEFAQEMKNRTRKAQESAVLEASFYIGRIESLSPLTISAEDGQMMYEGEDLVESRVFSEYSSSLKQAGKKVLLAPIDGVTTVAVIDLIKEG